MVKLGAKPHLSLYSIAPAWQESLRFYQIQKLHGSHIHLRHQSWSNLASNTAEPALISASAYKL